MQGPLNPVAPAKGHPIAGWAQKKERVGHRTHVTGQLLARLVRLLEENGPDHFCGFQKSLFKSWGWRFGTVYVSAGEEEVVYKQGEKNVQVLIFCILIPASMRFSMLVFIHCVQFILP